MLVLKPAAGAGLVAFLMVGIVGAAPSKPPPHAAEDKPTRGAALPFVAPLPPPDPRRARTQKPSAPERAEATQAGRSQRLPTLALMPWPNIIVEPEPPPPDPICPRLLADARAAVRRVAPIEAEVGCGLAEPVRLDAVMLADGSKVTLEPAPIMACRMAEATVAYVRDDLAAAALKAGAVLSKVLTAAAYECRGRNRVVGAKLSEHAQGNALDVRGIVLADKRIVMVAREGMPMPLIEAWRASACARFMTVLGPGSDGYHEDHIHVDLRERKSNYRLCQWELEPPEAAPSVASEPSP